MILGFIFHSNIIIFKRMLKNGVSKYTVIGQFYFLTDDKYTLKKFKNHITESKFIKIFPNYLMIF